MCKSHGIFRSYKDRSHKAVSLESLLKEENRKRAREEEMRARKEEILVGKRELVEQLKSALPHIEKRLHLAIRDRDLVAFAYNYCHYMVRMNASERMSSDALDVCSSIPDEVAGSGLIPTLNLMLSLLPHDCEYYKRDLLVGSYTVRDLCGVAKYKLLGISDCTEDFFTRNCKWGG